MGLSRLFGGGRVGTIALVDAPVSRSYAQKARLAFFAGGAVGAAAAAAALFVAGMSGWAAVPLGLVIGAVLGLTLAVFVAAWPVLRALWWWAIEIGAALGVAAPLTWLAHATSAWVSLVLVLLVAGPVAAVPGLRRQVVAWAWCVIVRHRLRLCFSQVIRTAGQARAGSLPLILWAKPTPAGERVWVWLRPGLDLAALDGKAGQLAVACWASEVRVVRASARFAALIRVDLSRRDPLAGDHVSPLAALFANMPGPTAPAETGHAEAWALDLEDVAAPEPVEQPRGRR
ncbi:hypothetical protein ACFO1B_44180 [Dactylosporangium siamense]|uniref:Uncharacterized protein n=1 Tax=Dactylosporangium siamense TaxID=685454 RepID=A0A919UD55_9ACTN|nr:hypothetical protein [Dactylosporangium siamense]GIG51159.1 hypothetical protein Dsi01nite_092000 [Dactylosporangium siamense]